MAIGRTEDRDTPRNPLMLRHRVYVQDPIRATHLGQRSPTAHTGRTHDRNRPDPSRQLHKILATRGPSTHGFRARPFGPPRNDVVATRRRCPMAADPDCIFCKIVAGAVPCFKLFEDAETLAFMDINPVHDGHALVIPKDHYPTVFDIPPQAIAAAA